jgi:zinc transporter
MLYEEIRPRSLQNHAGVLTVLRGVNLNPGSDAEDMVSIRVWLEKDRIISTRRRRLMSVQQIQEDLQAGNGPLGSGDFMVRLIENLGDRMADVIEAIDTSIEEAEINQASGELEKYRGEFGSLRRKTAHFRRYLSPQREALDRLSRMRDTLFTETNLSDLQEETNRMTLFVEELDLSRERAMVAQEEMLSQLAHEQNSKMYLLSLVAAIFLPLSFLTGLFGMNVAGLPGLENPQSFNILAGAMVALGIGILLLFRWKKWL